MWATRINVLLQTIQILDFFNKSIEKHKKNKFKFLRYPFNTRVYLKFISLEQKKSKLVLARQLKFRTIIINRDIERDNKKNYLMTTKFNV